MAKKSFIPPSLFLSVIVIVILTSLVVRWILPDDGDLVQSNSQSDDYLNFFRNLELPEELQTNVNQSIGTEENVNAEDHGTGYLLSVSTLEKRMIFTSDSQEFTSAFPQEVLAIGDEWLPSALAVTPHVMVGDAGLATTSEIMDADENVIATAIQYFDFSTKTTRELTRIDHETHASGFGDGIVYLTYDDTADEIVFLVNRDFTDVQGSNFRQDVYAYSVEYDSRSLLDSDDGTTRVNDLRSSARVKQEELNLDLENDGLTELLQTANSYFVGVRKP